MSFQIDSYDEAHQHAFGVIMGCRDVHQEPADYKTYRLAFAMAFRQGEMPELPIESCRKLNLKEEDVHNNLQFQGYTRLCKAHIGLCHQELAGTGALSPKNVENARHQFLRAGMGEWMPWLPCLDLDTDTSNTYSQLTMQSSVLPSHWHLRSPETWKCSRSSSTSASKRGAQRDKRVDERYWFDTWQY